MTILKPGDKLKRIKTPSGETEGVHIGTIYEVKKLLRLGRVQLFNTKTMRTGEFYEKELEGFFEKVKTTALERWMPKAGDKLRRIKANPNSNTSTQFVGGIYEVLLIRSNVKRLEYIRPDGLLFQRDIDDSFYEQFVRMGVEELAAYPVQKIDPYAAHRADMVRKGIEDGGSLNSHLNHIKVTKNHDMLAFERKHTPTPTDEMWGEEFECS